MSYDSDYCRYELFYYLPKINRFDILQRTFKNVLTTDQVVLEYGPLPGNWVEVQNNYDKEVFQKINQKFGAGEASCIALAQQTANALLIIDDRRARRVAEGIGIRCVGSAGVLLLAKREGVIENIKVPLDAINKTDFRLSEKLYRRLLELAGEVD